MFRALTIIAAIAALAVTAAPASAGLLSSPLGLTNKPKPAAYDHGITQGRTPPPRGTAGCTLISEVGFPKVDNAFMDYTDDSCMAKSRSSSVKARPKPRGHQLADIPDGTSNTMLKSGSLKPSRNGIIAILIG